jgi:NADH-quinone oxidoreductase subunit M
VILSWIIGLPILGAVLVGLFPWQRAARILSLAASIAVFAMALLVYLRFDPANSGFQFKESLELVPALGIHYSLGLDGLSLWLVVLCAFVVPCVVLASPASIPNNPRGYYASVMLLEAAALGTLLSTDLFLFYLFWELMLIPAFFLIGLWGGQNRVRATLKFVLYTLAGSLFMLVGLLYLTHETRTFDYVKIFDHILADDVQFWCFLAFALAFLIKVPVFPLHGWLPEAYAEAPTGGTVLLSAILVKMGVYGLLRFCIPLFPLAAKQFAPWIMLLAVVAVVHGSLMATLQTNFKKMLAYSSLSHVNLILLGIFTFSATGLQGGVFQMLGHGVYITGLFLLAGLLADRRGTMEMESFGGLAPSAPGFAFLFLWFIVAAVGVPGFCGFIGEILILVSAYKSQPALAIIAITGFVLGAWYLFNLFGRIFWGPSKKGFLVSDLNKREIFALLPVVVAALWIGLSPNFFLRPMEKSLQMNVIEKLKPPPTMMDYAAHQRRIQQEVEDAKKNK